MNVAADPAVELPEGEALPEEIHVAIFNDAGRYIGVKKIAAADRTDDHVEVPHDCDLATGRYRWDGKAFQPVAADPQGQTPVIEPNALNAIALGFMAFTASGISLPAATTAWLDSYARTVDFQSVAITTEGAALLAAFNNRKGA